jgi:cytochrome-b5 reductase
MSRSITLTELSTHKTIDTKVWISLHGKIYDITSFIKNKKHPGEEKILFDNAGQDATDMFEEQGHSSTARDMLEKEPDIVLMGTLEGYVPKPTKQQQQGSGGGIWNWMFGSSST